MLRARTLTSTAAALILALAATAFGQGDNRTVWVFDSVEEPEMDVAEALKVLGIPLSRQGDLLEFDENETRRLIELAREVRRKSLDELKTLLAGEPARLLNNYLSQVEAVGPDLAFLDLTGEQVDTIRQRIAELEKAIDKAEDRTAERDALLAFTLDVHKILEPDRLKQLGRVMKARQSFHYALRPGYREKLERAAQKNPSISRTLTKIESVDLDERIVVGTLKPAIHRVYFAPDSVTAVLDGERVAPGKLAIDRPVTGLFLDLSMRASKGLLVQHDTPVAAIEATVKEVRPTRLVLDNALPAAVDYDDGTVLAGEAFEDNRTIEPGQRLGMVVTVDDAAPRLVAAVALAEEDSGMQAATGLLIAVRADERAGRVEIAARAGGSIRYRVADDFRAHNTTGKGPKRFGLEAFKKHYEGKALTFVAYSRDDKEGEPPLLRFGYVTRGRDARAWRKP